MTNPHPSHAMQRGFMLVMTTVFFWATLAIVMKVALRSIDVMTLTWARFFSAALVMLIYLGARGKLGAFKRLPGKSWMLLLIACVMLCMNFVGYIQGVDHTTPSHAQLLIQLAPILMTVGGVWVFREPFARGQWMGLALLVLGLAVYFFSRQAHLSTGMTSDGLFVGTMWLIFAAITWAVYALIQKFLLGQLSSPQILLVVYVGSALVLLPWADWSAFAELSSAAWLAVIYCCINTLAAYGAFAEALHYWPASRVGALIATTPMFTWLLNTLCAMWWPQWVAEDTLTWWAGVGLLVAVVGAAITSFWKAPAKKA